MIKGTLSAEPGEGLYPCFSASGQDVWHTSYMNEGDAVIVSAVGARCGKAFMATGKWSAIANTHILFPKAGQCTLRYLHMVANNEDLWIRGGSAQPFVRVATTLREREIYLPPLAEQHRIVAKVDELMALCDRLEAAQQQREQERTRLTAASWQALVTDGTTVAARFVLEQLPALTTRPAQVKALRQTILDLAVRGKLVEQDERDEVSEISTTKSSKSQQRSTGLIKEIEGPYKVPNSWQWVPLGALAQLKHGFAFESRFFTSEHAPYVLTTPGNFHEHGGFRDREAKRKYYTGPVDPAFIFKPGDLIIPMTEQAAGLLGSPAFIPDNGLKYIHNQRIGRVLLSEQVEPKFAYWYFNCRFFRGELARTSTGAKVKHTSPGRVLSVPFPLPPLAEQGRIVAKVDELMVLCDRLEAALVEGEALGGRLLEAVLHTAAAPRTMPPAPVHQLVHTRQPKQAVYEEAEEELALAAEPGVALRRGPGRPRKVSDAGAGSAEAAILGYLQTHGGWHAKSAVLEATGVDAGEWNAAIKGLMEAGKVERIGEKKGARYTISR